MPVWEAAQIALGLAVIPLLGTHMIGTRGAQEWFEIEHDYSRIVYFIWSSTTTTAQQVALVVVTWFHTALGLHFWLRLRPWYRERVAWAYSLYIMVPVLALLGFARAAGDVSALASDPAWVRNSLNGLGVDIAIYQDFVFDGRDILIGIAAFAIAAVLIGRISYVVWQRRTAAFVIEYDQMREVFATAGESILEAVRRSGIPHASVCGGRGRCTTCRIRIGEGLSHLPPPSDLESNALARIGAGPTPLVDAGATPGAMLQAINVGKLNHGQTLDAAALAASGLGGVAGRETNVTCMFIDMRGSTKLGETRLPYDVLFILNQFFRSMSDALKETNGHYAQFNGDGLMALYGVDGNVAEGARQALKAVATIHDKMSALNQKLENELAEPLRIGIGLHTGEAIVGVMGPPSSPILSAIGDNINIAARLESLTKELDSLALVSADVLEKAAITGELPPFETVDIRGRAEPMPVWVVHDRDSMTRLLGNL
jgi:adenylate cyclase